MRLCKIEGCLRKHRSNGYCEMHFGRWQRGGNLTVAGYICNPQPEKCIVGGCDRKARTHSFCELHYKRFKKYGNPLFNKRTISTKVKKQCRACGKEYFTWKSQIKHRGSNYCSRKCLHLGLSGETSPIWKGGKERRVEYMINFKKTHKELISCYSQNRRALKKKGGKLTVKIIQLVYEDNIKKYGTLTCYLCEKPIEFGKDQLEHKTPLCRGGTNEYNNLAIACQFCNCSKHDKTEAEYRNWIINKRYKNTAKGT